MKYVAILLSVYMIILALMPCQDEDDRLDISISTTISKSKTCNDQAGQEICPPFCTCNCCSTARYIATEPLIAVFTKDVFRNYPAYGIPAVQQQSIGIWQPPQIA